LYKKITVVIPECWFILLESWRLWGEKMTSATEREQLLLTPTVFVIRACAMPKIIETYSFRSVFRTSWYTFRPGGHVCMIYVKILLHDSCLSTVTDLSQAMASPAEWYDICNVVGVVVDASIVST